MSSTVMDIEDIINKMNRVLPSCFKPKPLTMGRVRKPKRRRTQTSSQMPHCIALLETNGLSPPPAREEWDFQHSHCYEIDRMF